MEKETLKRVFEFLEENETQNPPFLWKLINDMPLIEKDLNIEGDLNLHSFKKLTSLPEGLKIGGKLSLIFADIESLPEGLKVDYNLYLQSSKITSLPNDLKVDGDLYVGNTIFAKMTDEKIRAMIPNGYIKGRIIRK